MWRSIRNMPEGDAAGPAPVFVTESSVRLDTNRCDYDVAVCGGTLGILVATALQARGQRVVVIERGPLRGRDQEWNISRPELESLVALGVLTQAQCDEVITKEFNPIRCGFYDGESGAPSGDASAIEPAIVTKDILNTGVKPSLLLDAIRGNFEAKGGVVLEKPPYPAYRSGRMGPSWTRLRWTVATDPGESPRDSSWTAWVSRRPS